LPEAPPASTTLRVTPTTADRIERELQAVRDRLLELRAERSRMNDELRRLGDMHGSLDEALGDASPRANSGVRAGRRRQDVEERERTLGNAQSSLEVEERTLMRSRIVLERLLRELRRRPDALPRAVS
jgi:chromosome segregation ATPase